MIPTDFKDYETERDAYLQANSELNTMIGFCYGVISCATTVLFWIVVTN